MAETYKLLMCLALIMGLALASPCVAVDVTVSWADITVGSLSANVGDNLLLPISMILMPVDTTCDASNAVNQFRIDAPGNYPFGVSCALGSVLTINAT